MIKRALAFSVIFFLAACGGGDEYSPYGGTDHPTRAKLGKPYTIKGKIYTPRYNPNYKEVGIASWYGPNFDGRMTASGEQFDEDEITAAHRTLPMPSIVRVTVVDTGKSMLVRINDRGPFAHNRIIDLSKGTARELGVLQRGTAKVKVEYLPRETEYFLSRMGIAKPDYMKNHAARSYAGRNGVALPSSIVPQVEPQAKPRRQRVAPQVAAKPAMNEPKKTYVLQKGYGVSPFAVVDQ